MNLCIKRLGACICFCFVRPYNYSMEELLVCVSTPLDFDRFMFGRWTEGKEEDEVAKEQQDLIRSGKSKPPLALRRSQASTLSATTTSRDFATDLERELPSLLRYEVYDQFRSFEILEHFLCQPALLRGQGQLLVQIPEDVQTFAVERYWALDDVVVREVLSKKLTKVNEQNKQISKGKTIFSCVIFFNLSFFLTSLSLFSLFVRVVKILMTCLNPRDSISAELRDSSTTSVASIYKWKKAPNSNAI